MGVGFGFGVGDRGWGLLGLSLAILDNPLHEPMGHSHAPDSFYLVDMTMFQHATM